MLKLLDFIKENVDWEERLTSNFYRIRIKRSDGYIIFAYNMDADFSIDVVRECRGIILDETDNYKPVCVPFFKFGNYGDTYADEIDWNTARVQEKIDGSIIKVWHHKDVWHISTNNTIDAGNARTDNNDDIFLNIFNRAWERTGKQFSELNPDYTYMFELISPQTRVVIPYSETKLYHIGTRDINTLQELNIDIGIEKPKEFNINTIEACIETAKNLDRYHEGFVVVDSKWRRVKVKSPVYVAIHHLLNNISSEKRVIDILFSGEDREVVSYFPEYEEVFNSMRKKLDCFVAKIEHELETVTNLKYHDEKKLADCIKKTTCPACLFYVTKGKSASVKDFIYNNMSSKKIIAYMNK